MITILDRDEKRMMATCIECYLNENCVASWDYTILEDLAKKIGYKIEDNGLYQTLTKEK